MSDRVLNLRPKLQIIDPFMVLIHINLSLRNKGVLLFTDFFKIWNLGDKSIRGPFRVDSGRFEKIPEHTQGEKMHL